MGIEFGEDEVDKKIRGGVWDPLQVKNKDPNKHYRWLNKNKLNLARKTDYLGYEIVKGKEASVLTENTPLKKGVDVDGCIEVGDLVLGSIPKELHEEYEKRNAQKIRHRTQGAATAYRQAVNKAAGSAVGYEEHTEGVYRDGVTAEELEEKEKGGK